MGLLVGLIRIALGALRLGLLIDLLSSPVVVGFTNAAAFIIAVSQLHKVFGVEPQQGGHLLAALRVIDVALLEVHWPTLGMAVLAGGLLAVLRPRSLATAEHVDDAGSHHTRFLAGWI